MLLLVLERVEILGLINDSTEHMPMLLIIVEFDITLERRNKALSVLNEKLLHSLDEDGVTSFSKDGQEGAVPLRDNLRHQDIDNLP